VLIPYVFFDPLNLKIYGVLVIYLTTLAQN